MTRSLRWFNVGSLVFILLSVQCSLVLRPCIFHGALQFSFLIQCSLVLRPAGSFTAFRHHVTRSLRRFHVGSAGSSPCWLDHCVSTPCDSITHCGGSTLISRFFALQAQSLCFNTMCLDHCGGSKFDLPVLRPAGSITAFQHHVTRSLRWFNVGSLVFILLSVQCSLVLRPWIFLRWRPATRTFGAFSPPEKGVQTSV